MKIEFTLTRRLLQAAIRDTLLKGEKPTKGNIMKTLRQGVFEYGNSYPEFGLFIENPVDIDFYDLTNDKMDIIIDKYWN